MGTESKLMVESGLPFQPFHWNRDAFGLPPEAAPQFEVKHEPEPTFHPFHWNRDAIGLPPEAKFPTVTNLTPTHHHVTLGSDFTARLHPETVLKPTASTGFHPRVKTEPGFHPRVKTESSPCLPPGVNINPLHSETRPQAKTPSLPVGWPECWPGLYPKLEVDVQRYLMEVSGGQKALVDGGEADVVTDGALIEIKRVDEWFTGLGQLLWYSQSICQKRVNVRFDNGRGKYDIGVPHERCLILYLFGEKKRTVSFDHIDTTCRNAGVLTWYHSREIELGEASLTRQLEKGRRDPNPPINWRPISFRTPTR